MARVHDNQHFDAVLDDLNTSAEVYTYRSYPRQEREEQLKAQGYRGRRIQREGSRNHPLSECQQRRNNNIATVRALVEHIFAAIEEMGGRERIRTIG